MKDNQKIKEKKKIFNYYKNNNNLNENINVPKKKISKRTPEEKRLIINKFVIEKGISFSGAIRSGTIMNNRIPIDQKEKRQYESPSLPMQNNDQLPTVSPELLDDAFKDIIENELPSVSSSREESNSVEEVLELPRNLLGLEEPPKIEVRNLLLSISDGENGFSEVISESLGSLSEEVLEVEVIRPSARRTSKNTKLLKVQKRPGDQNLNYVGIISQGFSKTNMK